MVRENTAGDHKWDYALRYMKKIRVVEGMMKIWDPRKRCAGS
jgi:hypothetical protein